MSQAETGKIALRPSSPLRPVVVVGTFHETWNRCRVASVSEKELILEHADGDNLRRIKYDREKWISRTGAGFASGLADLLTLLAEESRAGGHAPNAATPEEIAA